MTDKDLIERFFAEITRRKWTVEQAADAINVGRSTLFYWQKTGKLSKRGRCAIAAFIPLENKATSEVEPFHGKAMDFPVISEAAAAQCNTAFIPIADWADQQAEDRVSFSEGRVGDFVLRVSGESMLPWYPPNTLILARPNERPKNGDRVIAVLGSGEVVFKVFAENGEYFYLLSVNDADGQNFKFRKDDFAAVRAIYLVIQSMRDERALDRAMDEKGIAHFWESKIMEL